MLKSNSLEAAYSFERDARDWSGNGNNGTVQGATLVKGLRGNGYSFITNDYIENTSLAPTVNGTISVTFLARTWGGSASLDRKVIINNASGVVTVESTGIGQIRVGLFEIGGAFKSYTFVNLSLDTYYNVTFTFDTSELKMYLDSKIYNTQSFTGLDTSFGNGIWIGKVYAPLMIRYWDGIIDSLHIYSKVLPLTDIQRLNRDLHPLNG